MTPGLARHLRRYLDPEYAVDALYDCLLVGAGFILALSPHGRAITLVACPALVATFLGVIIGWKVDVHISIRGALRGIRRSYLLASRWVAERGRLRGT